MEGLGFLRFGVRFLGLGGVGRGGGAGGAGGVGRFGEVRAFMLSNLLSNLRMKKASFPLQTRRNFTKFHPACLMPNVVPRAT